MTCSGVAYFLILPSGSNMTMLLVLSLLVTLNAFSSPSFSIASLPLSVRVMMKCTVVSVWYSL
jgi:hypothetical protein